MGWAGLRVAALLRQPPAHCQPARLITADHSFPPLLPTPPPPPHHHPKQTGSLVAPPEACASWKEWAAGVQAAAAGEPESGATSAAAVRSALQAALQQLEEALLAESVGGLAADGESSDGEDGEGGGATVEARGCEDGSPGAGGISRTQVGAGGPWWALCAQLRWTLAKSIVVDGCLLMAAC